MRIILALLLLCSGAELSAQRGGAYPNAGVKVLSGSLFFSDVNGFPLQTGQSTELIEGTPFFTDQWLPALLVLPGGKGYEGVLVRLDLLHNQLQYRDPAGRELVLTTPLHEIVLRDSIQNQQHRFVQSGAVHATAPDGWYQALTTGPLSLYKSYQKELTVNKRYGSASEEARVSTRERLWLVQNGQLTEVKKFKEAAALLTAAEPRLEAYAKELRNGSGTTEQNLEALVARYNLLRSTPAAF